MQRKAELKEATKFDASSLASKTDLASLKTEIDDLMKINSRLFLLI